MSESSIEFATQAAINAAAVASVDTNEEGTSRNAGMFNINSLLTQIFHDKNVWQGSYIG